MPSTLPTPADIAAEARQLAAKAAAVLPSPADVLHFLTGNVQAGFDPADVAEIRISFGDKNKDGTLDVRARVFARDPIKGGEPVPVLQVGPRNIPITEAMRLGAGVVGALPVGAAPVAGAILGAAAGAAGQLEALLLKK